ncbi:putative beta-lactamase family protein [Phaeomoniella chlamydospora]|uniref:Putative beta-lactamase family protein n=1 Tax=Phaeomoniella chlamydospora TaxID=158046 RepID=A0A0G2EEQ2_PHACM|nr:putative beta-lactamase family protein [Phaeomoniella chlamydospora]
MAAVSLSDQAIADLRMLIDNSCADEYVGLPCASVVVIGKGQDCAAELFSHAARSKAVSHGINLDLDSDKGEEVSEEEDTYWLASSTKLITAIACMQLVEQGKLGLDDADQVENLCPELRDVEVLQENGILVEKQRRITLRMLLTHTGESHSHSI